MDIDRIERFFFMDVNGYTVNIPYLFQQRGHSTVIQPTKFIGFKQQTYGRISIDILGIGLWISKFSADINDHSWIPMVI